jgi:hypothetical protein
VAGLTILNTVSALSVALALNSPSLPPREPVAGSDEVGARGLSSLSVSGTASSITLREEPLSLEMAQYQALVERHPRLKGEFDWSRAAAGFYRVIRVPATKSFEASLAIYPQSHLTWTGTDALSTFDLRTNEIAVARLRPASPPVVPEDLSLTNRISRKLLPEIYSFLAPADSANFVWAAGRE